MHMLYPEAFLSLRERLLLFTENSTQIIQK